MATQRDEEAGRYDVVRATQRLSTVVLRFVDRAGSEHGLHRSDLHALQVLAEAPEQTASPSELARALSLSPSATTTVLDRLERAGHVRRDHDRRDRRRVVVSMTPSAQAEARAMFGPLAASMLAVMDGFDAEEIEVVGRFLRDAADAIERMR